MLRSFRERSLVVPLDGATIRAAVQFNNFLACLLKEWEEALLV